MLALLFSLFLSTAQADGSSCVECCQQSGLISCPTQIRLFGDGSIATPEAGGWRIIGLWWLDCSGSARFEPGGTVVINHQPRPGEILRLAYPPATVSCFGGHCSLPQGACLVAHDHGQNFAIAHCQTGSPLTASQMQLRSPTQVQIRQEGTTVVHTTGSKVETYNTVSGRTRTESKLPEAPPIDVVIELPAPPGASCEVSDLLRAQSRRQQEDGDKARVENRAQEAADRYQAALSLDPCNTFAWHAIGQLAISGAQLETAIHALRVAVRLVPGHYGAYTSLGEAYERHHRLELASEAYHKALSIHPQHSPALVGLARIQASR